VKTVEQLLRSKSNQIFSIAPGVTVFEGLKLMAEKNIGALVVIEAGRVVGIFSERDYARKVTLEGKSSKDTPIRDVMTARVIGVTPANTVEDCMALMTDKHIRHLPVLDDEQLVGVISIGDVVKSIIAEQGLLIEHLVHYITGR
jgi:CBS domain-containing protein